MCDKQSLSHPAYIMIFCVMLYESYSSSIEHTSKAICNGSTGLLALLGASWGSVGPSRVPLWGLLGSLGEVLGAVDGLKRRNAKKRTQHNDAKTMLLASRGGSLVGRKHEEV